MRNSGENNLQASPCIRNCCLDECDVCLGCFRSMNEIMQWTLVDEETRQEFLKNADQRKLQSKKNLVAKDSV